MPYELSFTKTVAIDDPERYVNDCCVGGDVVAERLRPGIEARFGPVEPGQENWGWYVRFDAGDVSLAVDVVCDDPTAGDFRIHLTSKRRTRRWWRRAPVVDTPELEELRATVEAALAPWTGSPVRIVPLDADYVPLGDA